MEAIKPEYLKENHFLKITIVNLDWSRPLNLKTYCFFEWEFYNYCFSLVIKAQTNTQVMILKSKDYIKIKIKYVKQDSALKLTNAEYIYVVLKLLLKSTIH
jgi:hypothetical protein